MLTDRLIEALPTIGIIVTSVYGFFLLIFLIFEAIGKWCEKE